MWKQRALNFLLLFFWKKTLIFVDGKKEAKSKHTSLAIIWNGAFPELDDVLSSFLSNEPFLTLARSPLSTSGIKIYENFHKSWTKEKQQKKQCNQKNENFPINLSLVNCSYSRVLHTCLLSNAQAERKKTNSQSWISEEEAQSVVHKITSTSLSLTSLNVIQRNGRKEKFVLYYFIVLYCFRSTHNELEKNR